MEFMFDDEVEEVGAEMEAFCPKCKTDTSHVVVSKYEEEVRRVQCNPCGDVHTYKKPRGEAEDDVPEPLAAKRKAALKKPTWEEGMARYSKTSKGKAPPQSKPYSFRATYSVGELVSHPRFGDGFVSEVLADNKVEITFKEGRRILVHNRSDLASSMLIPAPPLEDEKGQRRKAPQGKAQPKAAGKAKPVQPTVRKAAATAKALEQARGKAITRAHGKKTARPGTAKRKAPAPRRTPAHKATVKAAAAVATKRPPARHTAARRASASKAKARKSR